MEQLIKNSSFRKFHGVYWLIAGSALFLSGLSQGPLIVSLARNAYFAVSGIVLTYLVAVAWRKTRNKRHRGSLLLFLAASYLLGTVLAILINPVTFGQLGVAFDQLTWKHIFAGSMNFGMVVLFWAVVFYFLFERDQRIFENPAADHLPVNDALVERGTSLEVEEKRRTLLVPIVDISHLRAAGDYVEIHMIDRRTYLKRATMLSLRQRLERAGFVEIHRSIVINRNALSGFDCFSKGSYELVMKNGERLQTSRRYKAHVSAMLEDAGCSALALSRGAKNAP